MARPRKSANPAYRVPTFHKPSGRWRLRIEHGQGEKNFWWPAARDANACPPEVVAAAVAIQDEWRSLCEDWYPIMTVSKFLHFYNPGLFPIYDTEVVGNRVFKEFKKDYEAFRSSNNLASRAGDVAFLRNYLCWASSLVASAHPGFMTVFVDWLADELPRRKFEALGREKLATLYATAFEFTAIGAAVAEGA